MKTKILIAVVIPTALLLSAMIPLVLADLPPPAPVIPTQCTALFSTGWSTSPVINVRMHVVKDEDSGFVGYWALDDYQKTMIVWEHSSTPKTYCGLVLYRGEWHTFQGALSPQTGAVQPSGGSGDINGGYVATFTGTFLGGGSSKPLTGFIGTFDFGGTKADILKGSYGNGQTGPTPTSWLGFYFTGVSGFTQPTWAWTYTHGESAGYGSMWVNAAAGSFGDIITSGESED